MKIKFIIQDKKGIFIDSYDTTIDNVHYHVGDNIAIGSTFFENNVAKLDSVWTGYFKVNKIEHVLSFHKYTDDDSKLSNENFETYECYVILNKVSDYNFSKNVINSKDYSLITSIYEACTQVVYHDSISDIAKYNFVFSPAMAKNVINTLKNFNFKITEESLDNKEHLCISFVNTLKEYINNCVVTD